MAYLESLAPLIAVVAAVLVLCEWLDQRGKKTRTTRRPVRRTRRR
jgi:hypothetical protein